MTTQRFSLGALLAAMAIASQAVAGTVYYDGGQPRIVTLQPGLVADIHVPGVAGATRGGVQSPLVSVRELAAGTRSAGAAPQSPVYREGDSPGGRLMALPGGVIVNFRADWSDAQIQAWAAAGGYALNQRLNILGNWFLVDTAPGQVALDTANAIQQSGQVLSATPNWWKQTVTR